NAGSTLWGDFDQVGSNNSAFVWTVNMFTFSAGGIDQNSLYDHVQVVAVDKSNFSNFNTVGLSGWDGTNIVNENLMPTRMHGPSAAVWFAEESNYGDPSGSANALKLLKVNNILTASAADFQAFTVNVPAYSYIPVPDPSTGGPHPWNRGDMNDNA